MPSKRQIAKSKLFDTIQNPIKIDRSTKYYQQSYISQDVNLCNHFRNELDFKKIIKYILKSSVLKNIDGILNIIKAYLFNVHKEIIIFPGNYYDYYNSIPLHQPIINKFYDFAVNTQWEIKFLRHHCNSGICIYHKHCLLLLKQKVIIPQNLNMSLECENFIKIQNKNKKFEVIEYSFKTTFGYENYWNNARHLG